MIKTFCFFVLATTDYPVVKTEVDPILAPIPELSEELAAVILDDRRSILWTSSDSDSYDELEPPSSAPKLAQKWGRFIPSDSFTFGASSPDFDQQNRGASPTSQNPKPIRIHETYKGVRYAQLGHNIPTAVTIHVHRRLDMLSDEKGCQGHVVPQVLTIAIQDQIDGKVASCFWKLKHFYQFLVEKVTGRLENEYPFRLFDSFVTPYKVKFSDLHYLDERHVKTYISPSEFSTSANVMCVDRPKPMMKRYWNGRTEFDLYMDYEVSFKEPCPRQKGGSCPEKDFVHKLLRNINNDSSNMKTVAALIEAFEDLQADYKEYNQLPIPRDITHFKYCPEASPLIWESFIEFDNSAYIMTRIKHNTELLMNRKVREENEAEVNVNNQKSSAPDVTPPDVEKLQPDVTHTDVEPTKDAAELLQLKRLRQKERRVRRKQNSIRRQQQQLKPISTSDVTAPVVQIGVPKPEISERKVRDQDSAPPKMKKLKVQGHETLPDYLQQLYSQTAPLQAFDYGQEGLLYVPQTGITYRSVALPPYGVDYRGHHNQRGSTRGYRRYSGQRRYKDAKSIPVVPTVQ